MKPFPPRLGHPRACQPDPRLSSFPEEGAGETQPFSLQSASCPRRCSCRSGYPHPSLPPFWKHTLCRPATAPARQRKPRSPSRPGTSSRAPPLTGARGAGGGGACGHASYKGAGAVLPHPPPTQRWRRGGGGPSVWGGAGRGWAEVSEPGGNVRKGSFSSPSPGKPPATLPQLGRRLLPPLGPRPAAPAPPRLPRRRGAPRLADPRRVLLGKGRGWASRLPLPKPETSHWSFHILTRLRARPELLPSLGGLKHRLVS